MFYFFLKKKLGALCIYIWVRLSLISNRGVVVVTIFFFLFSVRYIYKVTFDRTIQTQYNKKRLFSFIFFLPFECLPPFVAVEPVASYCYPFLNFPILRAFFFSFGGWNSNPFGKAKRSYKNCEKDFLGRRKDARRAIV